MIHLTALAMTAVTILAALVRWDDQRRRPTWVWKLPRPASRARRWAGRGILAATGAALVLVPLALGPTAGAAPSQFPNPFSCAQAPQVDVPGKGLTAALDAGAATPGAQGSPRTPYGVYGYAGQLWNTYDLGCTSGITDPLSPTMTALSNGVFNVTKDLAAATAGLHYLLLNPTAFDWLNTLVQAVSGTMFHGVFGVWVQLALLIFGVILLWHAKTGDNAGAAKRSLWGLLGFWMAASAALMPVTYNDFFRQNLVDMTGAAQAGFIDPNQGNRANAMPDAVMKLTVYDNWLSGEFGAPNSPQAKKYGAQLLAAQACSKQEQATNTCNTKKKQADFDAVASKIKDEGQGYSTLQGADYWSRVSASVIAFYESWYIYLFQLVSKVIIVLSLVMVAVLIFMAPVTGLFGMINPDTLRGNIKTFGTAFINSIMMGLLGGLHIRLVIYLTHSGFPFLVQSLFLLLATLLMLMIARPIKRIKSMISSTLEVANASFPDSYRRMHPRPHPYRPQRPSDEFFQQQSGHRGDETWWEPGRQRPRWSATRGTPEEQPVGSGLAVRGSDGDSSGSGGTVFAKVRVASNVAASYATGGASTAATTMAGAVSGRGRRNESVLAGESRRLGELPNGSHPDHPRTGRDENARGGSSTGPQPHSEAHDTPPPASGSAEAGPRSRANPRSSFGMIDSEPDLYRPGPTETGTTDQPTVIDAHQDAHGTWYVPSESTDDNTTGGAT